MSVLIKGMEMPTACAYCELIDSLEICPCYKMTHDEFWENKTLQCQRHSDCPLIEVPDGHGRLIDADEFIKGECNICDGACDNTYCDCLSCEATMRCEMIKDFANAPTIIPADKEET